MIHRIQILLLTIFLSISFNYAHASAAEKWEYDVIPDQNQKLKVTGHKVDQFGDAVNDKKYTTTIDPKTVANKQKMGGVAIAKLLKKANWASVGVEAFQALLEGIDWVIDPASQSIWRNKPIDGQPEYGCKNWNWSWKSVYSSGLCPIDVARTDVQLHCKANNAETCDLEGLFVRVGNGYIDIKDFVGDVEPPSLASKIKVTNRHGSFTNYVAINKDEKQQPTPQEKEFLTPEQAADYANHTHPDYTNPKYKDKANPLYKPEIQEKLWKPHNEWEKENSPTVQEAIKQLEVANPQTIDDTVKENPPNEDGDKSWTLPPACDYFVKLCEYIDWVKEKPEMPETTEVEIHETPIDVPNTSYFSWGAYCPFTPGSQTISLEDTTAGIDYDLTSWCDLATDLRPFVLAAGALMSFLIAAGIVMGRDD